MCRRPPLLGRSGRTPVRSISRLIRRGEFLSEIRQLTLKWSQCQYSIFLLILFGRFQARTAGEVRRDHQPEYLPACPRDEHHRVWCHSGSAEAEARATVADRFPKSTTASSDPKRRKRRDFQGIRQSKKKKAFPLARDARLALDRMLSPHVHPLPSDEVIRDVAATRSPGRRVAS